VMIPAIIIPVLFISLIESKLILPSHLNYPLKERVIPGLTAVQLRVTGALNRFINNTYQPILRGCLKQPALTVSVFLAVFLVLATVISLGLLRFNFFPRVQSEVARATLTMPAGTSFEVTQRHTVTIENAGLALKEKYKKAGEGEVITDLFSSVGTLSSSRMGLSSNTGRVLMEMTAPEDRENDITSMQVAREWREMIGHIPGVKSLTIGSHIHGAGAAVDVVSYGDDFKELSVISNSIKHLLYEYDGLFDIADSYETGNEQIEIKLKQAARLLGITLGDLAHQVRWGFHGQEVTRFQRGRDEVKVFVRYPKGERESLDSLKSMLIKTDSGESLPLSEVAIVTFDKGPVAIHHTDRFRTIHVTAEANRATVNIPVLRKELEKRINNLAEAYPNVRFEFSGEAKEQAEAFDSLFWGFLLVLFFMYAMLAIPLHSYIQPFIVMSAIPFGLLGAVAGHLLMGIDLSIQSVLGMVALTGVVVNDSLVMVDYINQVKAKGMALIEAVATAGKVRFRAILLTSLTTFIGLLPLMFSDNTQAKFLIPMAVSLGYGVLFATFITLILVPCLYLMMDKAVNRGGV